MKFKTTSDKGIPQNKKAKRNNIRWNAIYANEISFRFNNLIISFSKMFSRVTGLFSSFFSRHNNFEKSYYDLLRLVLL